MNYIFDRFGWYAGTSPDPIPRATQIEPPSLSTDGTPDAPRANWTGYAWRVLPYVVPPEPVPPPVPVPQVVSRAQAKKALLLAGLLDNVQPAIDAIADATERALVQIDWDERPEFRRDSATLIGLGTALGLDSGQINELFRAAAALE